MSTREELEKRRTELIAAMRAIELDISKARLTMRPENHRIWRAKRVEEREQKAAELRDVKQQIRAEEREQKALELDTTRQQLAVLRLEERGIPQALDATEGGDPIGLLKEMRKLLKRIHIYHNIPFAQDEQGALDLIDAIIDNRSGKGNGLIRKSEVSQAIDSAAVEYQHTITVLQRTIDNMKERHEKEIKDQKKALQNAKDNLASIQKTLQGFKSTLTSLWHNRTVESVLDRRARGIIYRVELNTEECEQIRDLVEPPTVTRKLRQ